MKTLLKISALLTFVTIASCRKESAPEPASPSIETHTYSSTSNFYLQNGVPMQTYTVDASSGGAFTSPQGTIVTIPANAFIDPNTGNQIIGTVTMQFKDIYTKSDMLLSNMDTKDWWGTPLVSAGEFFMKAISGSSVVTLAQGQSITVKQPASNNLFMEAFTLEADTMGGGIPAWAENQGNAVKSVTDSLNMQSYVFSLYQFSYPLDSGTWSNSDNSSFFASYQQTYLTCKPADDPNIYGTDVFLVFKNINSMVHVYQDTTNFPYYYAPIGVQCTLVAIGVKGGKLYSSFVPFTITSNQTINFSLSATTTDNFKAQMKALK